jgi:hypothetical protein
MKAYRHGEEYIRDRWMTAADGRRRELTPSQQEIMRNEIAQGKQRQKLEFVNEA